MSSGSWIESGSRPASTASWKLSSREKDRRGGRADSRKSLHVTVVVCLAVDLVVMTAVENTQSGESNSYRRVGGYHTILWRFPTPSIQLPSLISVTSVRSSCLMHFILKQIPHRDSICQSSSLHSGLRGVWTTRGGQRRRRRRPSRCNHPWSERSFIAKVPSTE